MVIIEYLLKAAQKSPWDRTGNSNTCPDTSYRPVISIRGSTRPISMRYFFKSDLETFYENFIRIPFVNLTFNHIFTQDQRHRTQDSISKTESPGIKKWLFIKKYHALKESSSTVSKTQKSSVLCPEFGRQKQRCPTLCSDPPLNRAHGAMKKDALRENYVLLQKSTLWTNFY